MGGNWVDQAQFAFCKSRWICCIAFPACSSQDTPLPSLKTRAILALFQPPGTSPECQVAFQGHLVLMTGVPITWRATSLLVSAVGNATFPQALLVDSETWEAWGQTLLVKAKAKQALSTFNFPFPVVQWSSRPSFVLVAHVPIEALPLASFSSSWAWPFPALSLQA